MLGFGWDKFNKKRPVFTGLLIYVEIFTHAEILFSAKEKIASV
jgi:hypothetical protein